MPVRHSWLAVLSLSLPLYSLSVPSLFSLSLSILDPLYLFLLFVLSQAVTSLNEMLFTPSDNAGMECARSVFYFGSATNQHTLAALEWAIHNLPYGTRLYLLREEDMDGDHDQQWVKLLNETAKWHGGVWLGETVLTKQIIDYTYDDPVARSQWANDTARLVISQLGQKGKAVYIFVLVCVGAKRVRCNCRWLVCLCCGSVPFLAQACAFSVVLVLPVVSESLSSSSETSLS